MRWVLRAIAVVVLLQSRRGVGTRNSMPFREASTRCPTDARYEALARGEDGDNRKHFAFQPTGSLREQSVINEPIRTARAFDPQKLIFWDPVRNHYRCYFWDFREGRRDVTPASSQEFPHFALRDMDLSEFGLWKRSATRG